MEYLFAYSSSATAFGLLVGLGQGSVAGSQAFTGGIIHFSASTLHVALREARVGMRQLFITQKWLKLGVQFWKLPTELGTSGTWLMTDMKGLWNAPYENKQD